MSRHKSPPFINTMTTDKMVEFQRLLVIILSANNKIRQYSKLLVLAAKMMNSKGIRKNVTTLMLKCL